MNFYEFNQIYYRTDKQDRKNNPVELISRYHIPSIDCKVCGVWASSDRIRKEFDDKILQQFAKTKFLSVADWQEQLPSWSELLQISEKMISPGSVLGMPSVKLYSTMVNDVMHPPLGGIVVTSRVVKILRDVKATSVEFIPLKMKGDSEPDPIGLTL